jgi:hypothetical protein
MNRLQDRVARDPEWMYEQLAGTLEHDPFTAKFVQISKAVHASGLKQSLYF